MAVYSRLTSDASLSHSKLSSTSCGTLSSYTPSPKRTSFHGRARHTVAPCVRPLLRSSAVRPHHSATIHPTTQHRPPCTIALAIPSSRATQSRPVASSFFGCVQRTPFTRVPDTMPGMKRMRATGGGSRAAFRSLDTTPTFGGTKGSNRRSDLFSILELKKSIPNDFRSVFLSSDRVFV